MVSIKNHSGDASSPLERSRDDHDEGEKPEHEIMELKMLLRARARSIRYTLPPDMYDEFSLEIQRRLMDSGLLEGRQRVCCYVHKDTTKEVQTREILEWIIADPEKELIVPITIVEDWRLDLSVVNNLDDLVPSTFGVLEPREDRKRLVSPEYVDAFIVPGLAVDMEGNRLGYGKGYYDRLLATVPPGRPVIMLAFENQVVGGVPVACTDEPVTHVITERRLIKTGKRGVS